jgi:hypothetical protein
VPAVAVPSAVATVTVTGDAAGIDKLKVNVATPPSVTVASATETVTPSLSTIVAWL